MRQRVTVSVPEPLLKAAESAGRRRGKTTRSAVVVDALELFVREDRLADVDQSLDEYYRGRSTRERAEERAMVAAFRRARRKLDLDRDA